MSDKLSIGQVISILQARSGNTKLDIDTGEDLVEPLLELCKEFYDNGIELRKENRDLDEVVIKLGSAHEYINFLVNKLKSNETKDFFNQPKKNIEFELKRLFNEFADSEFNTLLDRKDVT